MEFITVTCYLRTLIQQPLVDKPWILANFLSSLNEFLRKIDVKKRISVKLGMQNSSGSPRSPTYTSFYASSSSSPPWSPFQINFFSVTKVGSVHWEWKVLYLFRKH